MSLEIREVDPVDEPELRRWWETSHEAMAGRPYDLRPTWETTRASMTRPHDDFQQTLLAAYDGDVMVGAGILVLPLADNLAMSYADVTVPERHRRRGVGSALLADLEARARRAGRSYVLVEVLAPVGVIGAGERFAAVRTDNADANAQMNVVNDQLGYRLVEQQLEVQKKLTEQPG